MLARRSLLALPTLLYAGRAFAAWPDQGETDNANRAPEWGVISAAA